MLRNALLACACLCLAHISVFAQKFQVQIAAYADSMPLTYFHERGVSSIKETVDQNGIFRYLAGSFNNREEAETVEQELKQKGFRFATILDLEQQRALCGIPCPYTSQDRPYVVDPDQIVKNIFFDFGKHTLSEESIKELDQMYLLLKINPLSKLKILGFTDAVGAPEPNIELATRRARTTRQYLINKGILPERLYIKVFGEMRPEPALGDPGKDAKDGQRYQRRVAMILVDTSGELKLKKDVTPVPTK